MRKFLDHPKPSHLNALLPGKLVSDDGTLWMTHGIPFYARNNAHPSHVCTRPLKAESDSIVADVARLCGVSHLWKS